MIPMLIEDAIHIKLKSDMHPAIISDYELAYALGYACRRLDIKPCADIKKMREDVIKGFESFEKRNIEDKNLVSMITVYEPIGDAKDNEKVLELIKMGFGEDIEDF